MLKSTIRPLTSSRWTVVNTTIAARLPDTNFSQNLAYVLGMQGKYTAVSEADPFMTI
jgi:hypothetical protein